MDPLLETRINTVARWMRKEVNQFYDPQMVATDMTAMAEEAAFKFSLYEGEDDNIPEWVFETAYKVASSHGVLN